MAKQSALPLLLVAGGAAVVMSRKKKKKKASDKPTVSEPESGETTVPPEFRPNWSEVYDLRIPVEGGGESERLVFNAECTEFAEKLNYDAHNEYITAMFHDLVEGGMQDVSEITMAMLKDQAPNCPWDDPPRWTDLMTALFGQLKGAVGEYAADFGQRPQEPPAAE